MADVNVTIRDNGPFLVEGNISIEDAEGNSYQVERKSVSLCRCGASSDQPFCNGTHAKVGFESAPRADEAV